MELDKDLRSRQEARERIKQAKAAADILAGFNQSQVDRIAKAICDAGMAHAQELAELPVGRRASATSPTKPLRTNSPPRRSMTPSKAKRPSASSPSTRSRSCWMWASPCGRHCGHCPVHQPHVHGHLQVHDWPEGGQRHCLLPSPQCGQMYAAGRGDCGRSGQTGRMPRWSHFRIAHAHHGGRLRN